MAASPSGEEDSVYDTGRLSLFDLILERTRAQNKVQSNYCFFLFGFVRFCLKTYFSFSYFKEYLRKNSGKNLTISLISFQKQLVHRLVYVSKIRQDVNDRKDIGGNSFTLQFSLHTTEIIQQFRIPAPCFLAL